MSNEDELIRRLREAATSVPEPGPVGEDATLRAVLERGRTRRPFPSALAAAAILVLGLGVALGFLWGRSGTERQGEGAEAAWAARERRLFEEAREALGENLAWLTSSEGEIKVALSPLASGAALRVIDLDLRDADGRTVARPRIVLPDGREAALDLDGLGRLRLTATARAGGWIEVRYRVEADGDGPGAAPPRTLAAGELTRLGEVLARGRTLSLFALAD